MATRPPAPGPLTEAEIHQQLAGVRRLFDPHQIGIATATENYLHMSAIFPGAHATIRLLDLALATTA